MLQNGARRTALKRWRHTPEQVIRELTEGKELLIQGHDVAKVCLQREVTDLIYEINRRFQRVYEDLRNPNLAPLEESIWQYEGQRQAPQGSREGEREFEALLA